MKLCLNTHAQYENIESCAETKSKKCASDKDSHWVLMWWYCGGRWRGLTQWYAACVCGKADLFPHLSFGLCVHGSNTTVWGFFVSFLPKFGVVCLIFNWGYL